LKNLLRIEHLNEEKKEVLEQICKEFCDTFYLEDDELTCTSTVSHEINTRRWMSVHIIFRPKNTRKR